MKSVRIKHTLGKTAGLKQYEAQKDRIPDVVPVNQHLNQLQTHDKRQNDSCNGNHHVLRECSDHAEDA